MQSFLMWVERVGNKLPHPFTLFVVITGIVLLLAELTKGTTVAIPGTTDTVSVVSLLNASGFRWFIQNILKNFIEFPPFKAVLVTMLGVAVAEQTGLFDVMSKRVLMRVPNSLVTAAIVFAGVMSNLASDAGIVFMPALAATAFAAIGRNPLVGIAAGYASAASGYFANLLITSHDATLTGITASALNIVPATVGAPTHIAINWYMAIASVVVLVPVGTWITDKIIEPRFASLKVDGPGERTTAELSSAERRGLVVAGLALLAYVAVIALLAIPANGVLRDPKTGASLLAKFDPVIPVIAFAFFISGAAYGIATGKIRSDKDVVNMMGQGMKSLSGFLVIAFAAAQLIAIFKETQLATVLAIDGAGFLKASGITGAPLIVIFLAVMAFINLFLYSGTSKWALLAPVFVPMFGLLGFSPAFTLAIYRIADSSTNAISPLFPYLPIILGLTMQYKKDAGMGTVLSMMMPYSIGFLIAWTVLAVVWYWLGLPVGPGAPIFLN